MALLAEEIVEEWLNRQDYFTIRGIMPNRSFDGKLLDGVH